MEPQAIKIEKGKKRTINEMQIPLKTHQAEGLINYTEYHPVLSTM